VAKSRKSKLRSRNNLDPKKQQFIIALQKAATVCVRAYDTGIARLR
jgi:hypothetical protein